MFIFLDDATVPVRGLILLLSVGFFVLTIVFFLVVKLIAWVKTLDIKFLRKEQQIAERLLPLDTRKPVLYLRSFVTDGMKITNKEVEFDEIQKWNKIKISFPKINVTSYKENYETTIAREIKKIGPFIGIGNKNLDYINQIGSVKKYFSDLEWKPEVTRLMDQSSFIIMRFTGRCSDGVLWEFEQIIQHHLSKTVFFIDIHYESTYKSFLSDTISKYKLKFPSYKELNEGHFLTFMDANNYSIHSEIFRTTLYRKAYSAAIASSKQT